MCYEANLELETFSVLSIHVPVDGKDIIYHIFTWIDNKIKQSTKDAYSLFRSIEFPIARTWNWRVSDSPNWGIFGELKVYLLFVFLLTLKVPDLGREGGGGSFKAHTNDEHL